MTVRTASPLAPLRLAARLARREVVRRPGRTLLVAALVAVPVAAMVVAAVWVRTEGQSPAERWRLDHGHADLFLTPPAIGPADAGAPADLIPRRSRQVSYRSDHGRVVRTDDGRRSSTEVTDLPMTDPLAAPIMQVTSGRAPARAGEVFLTRAVAGALDASVGDVLRLERPAATTWTVVGVGERSAWWGAEVVVVGPGTPFPWRAGELGAPSVRTVLVDLPPAVTAAQLAALSRFPGGVGFAPGVAAGLPGSSHDGGGSDAERVAWSWVIGAVVLTVVGIVITAAFAAGARRQLLSIGQLAANGASPSTLRRVLFLQGTWTGLLGAALGLALAAAVLAVAAPHADRLFGRDVDPYDIHPTDLVPIVLLGVATATLAALVPARTTARIPVLAAMAGRRPLGRVPRWLTGSGAAVSAGGLALLGLAVLGANGSTGDATVWVLTAILGGVAVLLGACAVAPGYVSVLEPLAHRLHGASRLAARSLARQRTRTGAVVSAVCATTALAVAATSLVLAADAKDAGTAPWMRADEVHLEAHAYDAPAPGGAVAPGPPQRAVSVPGELLAAVQEVVPTARVHHLRTFGAARESADARWDLRHFTPDEPGRDASGSVAVVGGGLAHAAVAADEEFLALYDLPAAARRALARDGAVAVGYGGPDAVDGTASVALVTEPAYAADAPHAPYPPGGPHAAYRAGEHPPAEQVTPEFEVRVFTGRGLSLGSLPRVVVTEERARALGLAARPGIVVLRAPRPLTEGERDAIQDLAEAHADGALDAIGSGSPATSVAINTLYPTGGLDPRLLESVLTGMALVLSLFVVAVSLALSAAETRDERDVLVVVGAPPRAMRAASGRKAFLLTFLGALLAVPVGYLPVVVFTAVSEEDLPTVFPWRVVALVVLAVPLVAAAVTTAASGAALRLRPVRVSTMAFD